MTGLYLQLLSIDNNLGFFAHKLGYNINKRKFRALNNIFYTLKYFIFIAFIQRLQALPKPLTSQHSRQPTTTQI